MRQHDITNQSLAWFSLDFEEGHAAGTMLQESRTGPRWTYRPGGNGKLYRSFQPDDSGTIAITVVQESKLHMALLAYAETDRLTKALVGPMVLVDNQSGLGIVWSNAFLMTVADEARGTDGTEFTWTWVFESRATVVPTDQNQNVVPVPTP